MKTTLAILTLLLATLLAAGFPFDRRGKEKPVQYAAWEDVNVLAHGLLQLGQGLKEHVDKTKGQMRDIYTKLKAFNSTMAQLGQNSQRLQAESEALRARTQGLEKREAQVLNASAARMEHAEEASQERRPLNDRMNTLEEKVDGMLKGEGLSDITQVNGNYSDFRAVQWMLESQNKRIDDLVERIRQQQEKLDKQTIRIRILQNQIQLTKAFKRKSEDSAQNGSAEQRDWPAELASDCHALFLRGERSSGVFTVQPPGAPQPFRVSCHMTADGGWTVIQRRQDGSVDFDQLWPAYQSGFGSLDGEFWLGLEKMHAVVRDADYVLKIQFSDWREDAASVLYPFHLGGEGSNYALRLLRPATEGLESALTPDPAGLPFSTRDRDHDRRSDANCAKQLSGGWWFSDCGLSNLNGRYFQSPPPLQRHQRKQGVFWKTWRGRYYPLKTTSMMVGPAHMMVGPAQIHRS